MPGNPLVRFDEGRVGRTVGCRPLSYSTAMHSDVAATQARSGNYRRVWRRPGLDRTPVRRVLFQGIVSSIFVMVAHVISDQSAEMLFVQRDGVFQNLSPATAHPSFRDSVLPRRLHARALHFQTGCFQECDDFGVKLRVPVEDDVSIRGGLGKSLPQLLDNPFRRRVSSYVEVKNLAPSVLNHEEAIEQLEGNRRYREEIGRDDRLAMIVKECQPALRCVAPARDPAQISSDRPFRDVKPSF